VPRRSHGNESKRPRSGSSNLGHAAIEDELDAGDVATLVWQPRPRFPCDRAVSCRPPCPRIFSLFFSHAQGIAVARGGSTSRLTAFTQVLRSLRSVVKARTRERTVGIARHTTGKPRVDSVLQSTSFLAFHYSNIVIRISYTISAVWLGMLNFFFLTASLSGLTCAPTVPLSRTIALLPFASAAFASTCALNNRSWLPASSSM